MLNACSLLSNFIDSSRNVFKCVFGHDYPIYTFIYIYIYTYVYIYIYIHIYIYMICSKRQNVVQVLHFLLIYECVYINIKINTGKTKAS